ncbi:hypothetical protein B0H12DRAFT_617038 [Mycena haematopus]|nr:hypothetical protein B0H12DRAFT_617038 [Mycena haematopus]
MHRCQWLTISRRHSLLNLRVFLDRRDLGTLPRSSLCDTLSSTRLDTHEPLLIRRGVLLTNIPPQTTPQQLLHLVHTGPLEYVKINEDATATLSFLHGHGAAQFVASPAPLAIAEQKLNCTWLHYCPLDPIVAAAVERDSARRTLLLCKRRDRADTWTAAGLRLYLRGEVEHVSLRELDDPLAACRQVAIAHFHDISCAIRAHARLRADPFMMSVRIAYGKDRCEPSSAGDITAMAALENTPLHPATYFPVPAPNPADKIYRPFTTVTLSNLHSETTVRDLCKRIFGGPLYTIERRLADRAVDITFFRPEDARVATFTLARRVAGLPPMGGRSVSSRA